MKMLGRRRAAQVVGRERQGRQEVTPAEGGRGIWQKHFGGSITRPLPSFDSNPTSPTMYDSHPSEKDHLSLRTDGVVQTNVAASTRGFTAFEHIYLKDGIWYIVNSNASGSIPSVPAFRLIQTVDLTRSAGPSTTCTSVSYRNRTNST